jgi:hypothetical protein
MTFEIDWSKIDSQYDWVAIDANGRAHAYRLEPEYYAEYSEWIYKYGEFNTHNNAHKKVNQHFQCGGKDYIYKRPEKVEAVGHKYAKLMLEYAQDALVSIEPWKLWEYSSDGVHWKSFEATNPGWITDYFYRRKSTLISVEIPAEHREAVEAYIKSLEQ